MKSYNTPVVVTLVAIIITGILGIRLITEIGVPQILIFTSYIILAAFIVMIPLSIRRIRLGSILNIILALIVIAAASSSPAHLNAIQSLSPLIDALILIAGAYVLQPILILLSARAFRSIRSN